jgi:hypothetical protein
MLQISLALHRTPLHTRSMAAEELARDGIVVVGETVSRYIVSCAVVGEQGRVRRHRGTG